MTSTTHLFSVLTQTCHNCGVSKADVEGNKVSSMCSKAIHSDTIERVSRAMCEADGNAPDRKVITYALEHLRGRGQGAMYLPEGTVTRFAWELYANLAEAAIQALQETHVMYTKTRVVEVPPDQQTKTTPGEWIRATFPDRLARPIAIPSRIHNEDENGLTIVDDCEMRQLEIPMSYVFAREYESLAADILNDPFKQETNRILARVESESQAHALQTAELVKQPVDFLALNKASST